MFGARVAREGSRSQERKAVKASKARPKQTKPRRGTPTAVAIVDGANKGEVVSLDGAPLLIGRGNDAAILLDDDYVSTRHARIGASGDQWYVEDLGSTNGTYVGNSRISQPTAISLGTQIRIGKSILELRK
jgi:pSer/pThr/pTyr-binding forkhead associated (FHA) protein